MGTPAVTYKTLRDEFAMVALHELCSTAPGAAWRKKDALKKAAEKAYEWANAMLKARESSSTESPTKI